MAGVIFYALNEIERDGDCSIEVIFKRRGKEQGLKVISVTGSIEAVSMSSLRLYAYQLVKDVLEERVYIE